jgi:hypothetical protein
MRLLAIDPGTAESGYVLIQGALILSSGVMNNSALVDWLGVDSHVELGTKLAIERFQNQGMIVGQEVFDTCVWVGRFQQAWYEPNAVQFVFRSEVKMHLCGNMRAKDPNIRQALLDLCGPQGVKAKPGPTYGVRSHAWAALAVAVTALAQTEAKRLAPENLRVEIEAEPIVSADGRRHGFLKPSDWVA